METMEVTLHLPPGFKKGHIDKNYNNDIMSNLILPFIILSIISCSCDKHSNVIPDHGRKIIINGIISTDSLLNVNIGKSAYIDDISGSAHNSLVDLDSVEVKVCLNGTVTDSLRHAAGYNYDVWKLFNPGNYRSVKLLPEPGHNYRITAKAKNLPDAEVTATIPEVVQIIKIDTTTITLPPGTYISNSTGVKCDIAFTDPALESNYYLLNIWEITSGNYFTSNNELEFSCADPVVEETLSNGRKNQGIAFSDKLINGKKYKLSLIINREAIGIYTSENFQRISFRLYSINEDFFDYIRLLNLYSKNFGNPLFEPVMLNSNVMGGYGMLFGAAISSYNITVSN